MPVDKFSISLPEDLLAELDEFAASDGLSRSAVIREAAADYVATRRSEQYAARRRERVDRAIVGFRAIADTWGSDDRPGTQYLRDLRAEIDGDPAVKDDDGRA